MDRRGFVDAAATLLAWPLAALAQPAGRVPRLGYVALSSAGSTPHLLAAFRQGLRERGWVEGQNIHIDTRHADGMPERLPALVAELLGLGPNIIVSTSSVATWAAKNATRTIPIVMTASADAVGEGLVASLSHPGGNITGMTFLVGPAIAGKQLELLREVVPAARRVAVLANPTNKAHPAYADELQAAARSLDTRLQLVQASSAEQIEGAFAAMTAERAAALLVLTDSTFFAQRRGITALAASSGIPALYSQREFVDLGGLASYGPSLADMSLRAATHVDKILKGARPGDIPVEQPTRFELVINSRTAKSLGLTPSLAVLARADEVIR